VTTNQPPPPTPEPRFDPVGAQHELLELLHEIIDRCEHELAQPEPNRQPWLIDMTAQTAFNALMGIALGRLLMLGPEDGPQALRHQFGLSFPDLDPIMQDTAQRWRPAIDAWLATRGPTTPSASTPAASPRPGNRPDPLTQLRHALKTIYRISNLDMSADSEPSNHAIAVSIQTMMDLQQRLEDQVRLHAELHQRATGVCIEHIEHQTRQDAIREASDLLLLDIEAATDWYDYWHRHGDHH